MKASFAFRRTRSLLNRLTQRERQAIDHITAVGWEARAFSVSFSVTRSCVKGLIYYDKERVQNEHNVEKEDEHVAPAPPAHARTRAQPVPPPAVPPARPSAQKAKHKPTHKRAAGTGAGSKSANVDRNALSACGSSMTFSDAAIAAQARVDAAKEPEPKRRRSVVPAQPAHEPAPEVWRPPAWLRPGSRMVLPSLLCLPHLAWVDGP